MGPANRLVESEELALIANRAQPFCLPSSIALALAISHSIYKLIASILYE